MAQTRTILFECDVCKRKRIDGDFPSKWARFDMRTGPEPKSGTELELCESCAKEVGEVLLGRARSNVNCPVELAGES